MYRFQGVIYGFGGRSTQAIDEESLLTVLEAFTAISLRWRRVLRKAGRPLPPLDASDIRYFDPGTKDPPIQDAVTTSEERQGACGSLCVYLVSEIRELGFEAGFVLSTRDYQITEEWPPGSGRLREVTIGEWHVRVRRQNGTIDDVSRRRGMR